MTDASHIIFPCHESRMQTLCKLVVQQFDRSLDDIVINDPTFHITNAIPPSQAESVAAPASRQILNEDDITGPGEQHDSEEDQIELENKLRKLLDYLLEDFEPQSKETETIEKQDDNCESNGRKRRIIQSRYPWTMSQRNRNTHSPSTSNLGTQDDGSGNPQGGDGDLQDNVNMDALFLVLMLAFLGLVCGCVAFNRYVLGNESSARGMVPPWKMFENTLDAETLLIKRFWDKEADSDTQFVV